MTDRPDTTTPLTEYTVSIDYHAPARPDVQTVVARSEADALAIARTMFVRSHTPECVIDAIAIAHKEPLK